MSLVQILPTDGFDIWKAKTNLVSASIGDLALLNAELLADISPDSDLVTAINHIVENNQRRLLIRAIAMA